MALPTSTIVMAVLTCIPFGLAIRDTLNGHPAPAHGDYGGDEDYEAEYARDNARREAEDAEAAAMERLEEAKKERLRAARRALYGAEVATLGSGFAGISLGMPEGDIRSETITALEGATGVDIDLLSNAKVDWITVKSERDASQDDASLLCSNLREDLQEAWGRGKTEDYENRYWVNPTTGTRASLLSSDDECRLSFERYAEPTVWVSKGKTSMVPIWLVGQPAAKLREHLGPAGDFDKSEPSVRWLGLGVGFGSGEARFEAHLENGKVVAITVTTDTLGDTRDAVTAQLTELYGEPFDDDDYDNEWWKSKPQIRLDDFEGAGVHLTIGTLPVYEE